MSLINTAAFKKWFRKSKVVDADGKPLVVYHGTHAATYFNDFHDFFEKGIYFSDSPDEASKFAQWPVEDRDDARVYPCYLKIEDPLRINYRGDLFEPHVMEAHIAEAKKGKHDGLIVRNIVNFEGGESSTTYIVWEPTQIKSALGNKGVFGVDDPDIRSNPKLETLDVNPWNYRKGGYLDAIFFVGKDAIPYNAYLHTISESYFDDLAETDEGRMALAIKEALDEAPHEFSFVNIRTGYGKEGNKYGVTGTGGVVEVIRKVAEVFVYALNRYKPKVVYFSAAESSRKKLYRSLAGKVYEHAPYTAFEAESPDSKVYFFIIHNDSVDDFEAMLRDYKIKAKRITK
jgi:hypothetical protein